MLIKLIRKFFNRLLRTNWKQKIKELINDVKQVATKIVKIINVFSEEIIDSFDTKKTLLSWFYDWKKIELFKIKCKFYQKKINFIN